MKSVGEVMAIGRTFSESLQKALRGLETGLTGLDEIEIPGLGQGDDKNAIRAAIGTPTPDRLRMVAQALRLGMSPEEVHEGCKIDPWFIAQFKAITDMEARVREHGLPEDGENLRMLKAMGFSDAPPRLALRQAPEGSRRAPQRPRRPPGLQAHRHLRCRVRLAHRLHVLDLRVALLGSSG